MTKTIRWYEKNNSYYNPYWMMHELRKIRTELHRKYRHNNRALIKKCLSLKKYIETEMEPKTRGWVTW